MNKIFITISSLVICGFVFAGFGFNTTFAQSSLDVQFESDPLFSETNFVPNESITRWVKVYNNSGQQQPISVEAINISDADNFGDVINLQIKEGESVLFNDTLTRFFNNGQIFLSNVPDADNTQYDFIATFLPESGNEYQGVSLGFDILIGFQGTEGGGDNGDDGGGGGGTGGGGTILPGLSIYSETVRVIDTQTTSVTITWATSYMSTSQVIYAIDGTNYTFDLNAPNFGYPYASPTPEDSNMVTFHTVTVNGLTPGTTYNFRCVSHASPPTITYEFSFTTLAVLSGEETGGQGSEITTPTGGTIPESGGTVTPGTEIIGPEGGVLIPTPEGGLTPSPEPGTEELTATVTGGDTTFGANMLAAIGSIIDSEFLLAISIILLIILIALIIKELRYRYLEYKKKKQQSKLF